MKTLLYYILPTISILWFYNAGIYSQSPPTLPDIVPVSPEAASIAKYVNYPVSHNTGLINISIPLYEIKSGDIVLPISLNYHASGLKVNENSGIIGSGWTLNAEPSISRSIQGKPDFGDYVTGNTYCQFSNLQLKAFVDGTSDGSPDHFYYKLPHKSGTFYFRKPCGNNTASDIVIIPYEPLKIQHQSARFTITDESGICYDFGGGESFTEYSGTSFSNMHATMFKANAIRSASTGSEMFFTYIPAQETCRNMTDGIIVADSYATSSNFQCYIPELSDMFCFPYVTTSVGRVDMTEAVKTFYDLDMDNNLADHGYIQGLSYVDGKKTSTIYRRLIEYIEFDQGTVVFNYDGKGMLTSIIIADTEHKVVRKITLIQSSFYTFSDKYKLDAVYITDKNGNTLEQYQFDYYNPNKVPLKTSKKVDHWGYSNGEPEPIILGGNERIDASNSMCAIPRHMIDMVKHNGETVQVYIGETDREPDEEYMKAGILTGIQYYTGAYRKFFYESNFFEKNGVAGMAGGLRIEHIEDYDPVTNQTLNTRYSYGLGENGLGYIRHIPSMDDYMVERTKRYTDNRTVRIRTYSSWSIPDLFRSGGPPVIYDYVTEYKEADNQMTKTMYRYHAVNDTWSGRDITCPFSYHYNDGWGLGHLVEKSVFNSETQAIVENYTCSYQSFRENTENVKITNAYYGEEYAYPAMFPEIPNNPPDTPPIILFIDYIKSGCVRKLSETTTKDGVVSQIDYQYDNATHLYPTRIARTNSNGITTVEDFTYPQDNISLTGNALIAKNQLVNSWKINTLLRYKISNNGQSKTVQTDYDTHNFILPSVIKTSVNNGAMENRIRYHKYNAYGNPVYVSYEGGPGIVYLWGYKNQHPIAKIENASYDEVKTLMGEANINNIAQLTKPTSTNFLALRNLRTLLPNAMVTVYEYMPLIGVIAVTDPSGRTHHYDYDTLGRLTQTRDDTDILQMFEYRNYEFP